MNSPGSQRIDEQFAGPPLDPDIWVASYLPAWSSYAEAAATYEVTPSGLWLSIPPEQGLWCPDRHVPPLRVSAVQLELVRSGSRSAKGRPGQPDRPGERLAAESS